jgi:hypothetical protein
MYTLLRSAAAGAFLLGALHTAIGVASYHGPSEDVLWFMGAGFSLFLIALLNLATWREPPAGRALRGATHLSNLAMLGFSVEAIRVLGDPPVYAVATVMLALVAAGFGCEARHRRAAPRLDGS